MLGGLIQTDTEALNTGVPLLNRVPGWEIYFLTSRIIKKEGNCL